jgi:hypothetical protein
MAGHIEALFSDDALCQTVGERALARAREEFSPKHHLERLEQAYQSAIARTPSS